MTSSPRVAPWYFAYLLLGLLTSGMLPFLLPLLVAHVSHRLDDVAYVTGAYYFGLLAAPVFGRLAERRHLHRPVFFGGFVLLAVGFAAFPFAARLATWFVAALAIGLATGAASTVATLFVLNFTAKPEWEPRIGWLQSFNGAGQLAGLVLAGALAAQPLWIGFILGAGLALLAILLGRIGLPEDGSRRSVHGPLHHLALQGALRATPLEQAGGGPLRHAHHLQWSAIRALPRALQAPFVRFLLAWAAYNFGVAVFFAYYPLLMEQSFSVLPAVTAFAYAAAAAVGIFLFIGASRLAARFGGATVFRAGLTLRICGFLLLTVPFAVTVPARPAIGLLGFLLVMLAWPVLSVSGTALAARLTPVGEGAAIGLLNASGALATVVGTFIGGPLVRAFGFVVAPVIGLAGVTLAALLVVGDRTERNQREATDSETAKSRDHGTEEPS